MPPPIEAFARTPHIADVAISLDRRFLAFITSTGDDRAIVIYDRGGKLPPKTLWHSSGSKNTDARWCGWVNSTRVLCSLIITGLPGDDSRKDGFIRQTRLLAANFDGSESIMLLNDDPKISAWYRDKVLRWPAAGGDTILIQLDQGRSGTSAYRLNVYTGAIDRVTGLARDVDFSADAEGGVRLARVFNDNATSTYQYRLSGQSDWRPWGVFAYGEPSDEFLPLAVVPGTNRFFGARKYRGRSALWEWGLDRRGRPHLVFSSAQADIGDLVVARSGAVLGVRYEAALPAVHYLDARARSVIEGADRLFPGRFNFIHDVTGDMSAYIVRSASDAEGGTFHLLDASTGAGDLQQLGTAYPELAEQSLGRMKPVEYPARDGVSIPSYLTLPAQGKPTGLIVMPHDGPDERTSWSFDYLRAFLVSRGYAVLEMNYRGSSGYGDEWTQAGLGQWYSRIHDDIADGARWAVEQGIVAPDRICIAGRGFGGLQALLAAIEDAGLYRCAISIGAWADLVAARSYANNWVGGSFAQVDLGMSNGARLRARSPVFQIAKVQIPVFLAHAARDLRVPASQSQEMADGLKRECKPHWLLILKDTDRELRWQSDRMLLLSGIEQFLERSLSGDPAAWPDLAKCRR